MVSEWMVNGNIIQFLKANVNADRLVLVRFLFRVPPSLDVNDYTITVACRRC
jgi:hypothetical protein